MTIIEEETKKAIEQIRSSLQNDGGDIEFVKMKEKTVYVKLKGACAGCPMAAMTLKGGVERMLQENVDKNLEVVNLAFEEPSTLQ